MNVYNCELLQKAIVHFLEFVCWLWMHGFFLSLKASAEVVDVFGGGGCLKTQGSTNLTTM